jgi:hypothetical protein
LFYLNHIFAPIFNISYRIRGGYNPILSTSLFEKMISNSLEAEEIFRAGLFRHHKFYSVPVQKARGYIEQMAESPALYYV